MYEYSVLLSEAARLVFKVTQQDELWPAPSGTCHIWLGGTEPYGSWKGFNLSLRSEQLYIHYLSCLHKLCSNFVTLQNREIYLQARNPCTLYDSRFEHITIYTPCLWWWLLLIWFCISSENSASTFLTVEGAQTNSKYKDSPSVTWESPFG